MPISVRLLTSFFSTLPAFLFGGCIFISLSQDHYWGTEIITALVFIITSLVLGYLFPAWLHEGKFDHPSLWLFIAGGIAWILALMVLGFLNFSPLCIGQDNGDGINSSSQCLIYTMLDSLFYSPLEFILLALNAVIVGKYLNTQYGLSLNSDTLG